MKNLVQLKSERVLAALLILVSVLAVSCTQEREYDHVYKGPKVKNKSMISENEDYLLVISSDKTPRNAPRVRPFWMGGKKRVRLKITESNISVYELEKNDKFTENSLNNRPVLTIPIQHVDYRCADDALGKCTHREEENNEIEWNEKNYFKLDFANLKQISVETLPIHLSNLGGQCFSAVDTKLVDLDLDENNINLIVEKSYVANVRCLKLNYLFDFSDFTFSARHHYSFAKLSSVASANYKPVSYSQDVENAFGYFKTAIRETAPDNSLPQSKESYLMKRWNPKKKTVVYYLNEAFNKPENAVIKQATYEGIKTLNNGLAKSGAKLRIELREPVEGMNPGDLRYNMIVMVEDPQSSGVIGYGPSVENPLTGEILKANTIMYVGTMKKYLKRTYEQIVREKLSQPKKEGKTKNDDQKGNKVAKKENSNQESDNQGSTSNKDSDHHMVSDIEEYLKEQMKTESQRIEFENLKMKELVEIAETHNKYLDDFIKESAYPGEYMNFHSASMAAIEKLVKKFGLKPWDQLSEVQKEDALRVLLPHTFLPTLIHEMGHNMGLRHNFSASEDKDNWYSKQELAEHGFHGEFKYSSVMDYAYKTTNELHLMGKYDIAAFKFAYAEKVELADGKHISLDQFTKNPEVNRKSYMYCSDEGVAPNPGCNRFDEGTSLSEIMENKIQALEELYERANFRNDRISMSKYDDPSMIGYLYSLYKSIRVHFERVETISKSFNLPYDNPVWEQVEFLKDARQSAVMGGKYFLDIVKTPGILCGVAKADNPMMISGVIPLSILPGSNRVMDCFDQSISDTLGRAGLIAVTQAGKSFASRKSPNNPNNYADQIDVRGIWMNKLLATHFLLTRELGSDLFDSSGRTDNYLVLSEIKPEIEKLLEEIMFDEITQKVDFDKGLAVIPGVTISYSLSDSHIIDNPMNPRAARMLDLPGKATQFDTEFIKAVFRESDGNLNAIADAEMRAKVSIRDEISAAERREWIWHGDKKVKEISIAGHKLYAVEGVNHIAFKAMETVEAIDLLTQASSDQIKLIIKEMEEKSEKKKPAQKILVQNEAAAINDAVSDEELEMRFQEALKKAEGLAGAEKEMALKRAEKIKKINPLLKYKIKMLPLDLIKRFAKGALKNKNHYLNLMLKLPVSNGI